MSSRDPLTIEVRYPAALELRAIRPEVRLEIGPLASWVPSTQYTIKPYAAEVFPKVFSRPSCNVLALRAERTFWEKATTLHQQAHRSTPIPGGYSRHYYDMYRLAESPVFNAAIADLDLLRDVVELRRRFYRSTWAQYELARPGSFRLMPSKTGA